MNLDTKPCPECGSLMTCEVNTVSELCVNRWMRRFRKARLAKFWSCWTCDHCELA